MAVKKDLGHTWQCSTPDCGKWNFRDAIECWKCHEPKVVLESKPKTRTRKAKANV